jgi:hypothetical protein
MRAMPLREGILAAPVLLYLSIGGVLDLSSPSALFAAGFLLGAAPIAGLALDSRRDTLWGLPLLGGVLLFIGVALAGFQLLAPWDSLFAGLLLGVPLAVLAALLRPGGESAPNFLLLLLGLVEGLGLRAAGGTTPTTLASGFVHAFSQQFSGLGAWSGGAKSPSLPLSGVADPVFLGLALLAIAGAVLGFLRVPSGEAAPRAAREFDLLLVAGALGAGAVFEAVALGVPTLALVVLAAATLATVVGLLWLLRELPLARSRPQTAPPPEAP